MKRCSDGSRALSVFLCLLTWDAPLVAHAWYYKRFGVLLNNIMLKGHYGGILLLPIFQLKSNYLFTATQICDQRLEILFTSVRKYI